MKEFAKGSWHFFGFINLINSLYVYGYWYMYADAQPPEPWFLGNLIIRFMAIIGFALDILAVIYAFQLIYMGFCRLTEKKTLKEKDGEIDR